MGAGTKNLPILPICQRRAPQISPSIRGEVCHISDENRKAKVLPSDDFWTVPKLNALLSVDMIKMDMDY